MKKQNNLFVVAALCAVFINPVLGQEEKKPTAAASEKTKIPKAETSITKHRINIGGVKIDYKATAGTLILRNEKDEPSASFGYTAYVKAGESESSHRPITFAYNGGPGSSSIWLHMGVLGPRRVVTTDAGPTPPPPYGLVDNEYSILDVSDLVMIDPVGTGFSRAVGKAKNKDFWGVDPDIRSVSQFISQYVSENDRWNSPKYLLGESYGTMRSAGVVNYLQSNMGMAFNGVVLISVFVDARTAVFAPGNDLAYMGYLPTYAAVAWYHKLVPNPPDKLEDFLVPVRAFAAGEYARALLQGNRLSAMDRSSVIKKMASFTGLSEDYIDRANLRVTEGQFTKELLRSRHETVGRLDSRFTGVSFNLLGEQANYDPQSAAISPAYTAAFLNYYHTELKFGRGKTYAVSARNLFPHWSFKHRAPGSGFGIDSLPNTGPDLARAMGYNPNLQILVLNGYYDLATPFFSTEYTMNHLQLEKKLQGNIHMKYYPAGHMMYLHKPTLKRMKTDMARFINSTKSASKEASTSGAIP